MIPEHVKRGNFHMACPKCRKPIQYLTEAAASMCACPPDPRYRAVPRRLGNKTWNTDEMITGRVN